METRHREPLSWKDSQFKTNNAKKVIQNGNATVPNYYIRSEILNIYGKKNTLNFHN